MCCYFNIATLDIYFDATVQTPVFFFLFNISYKISVLLLYLGICVIWYVWMFVSNACVSHGLSYCFCTMHLKLNEKYLWILIYGVNFIEVAELFLYLLHVYFF